MNNLAALAIGLPVTVDRYEHGEAADIGYGPSATSSGNTLAIRSKSALA